MSSKLNVDPLVPDFLTGVSSSAYEFSGTSSGTYAPDPSVLTSTYSYVVIGVEARANDNLSGLTAYLGRLTAPEPDPGDLWQQYTVADIESAVVNGLNAVYDYAASTLTFNVVSGCPSTIPSINFCGSLSAADSYSSSEMDSVCAGTCDAVYETCQVSLDACKVACCYGCIWGKTCSCNYDCSDERDACYNGCTTTFTGSAEVDVRKVTGLEKLEFTDASLPFLTEGSTIGVDATAVVSPGLTAEVYWKLCQSGVCISDTTPMQNESMKVAARGSLTAVACPLGAPALYMTIDNIEIIDPGVWGIDAFVDDVVAVAQSSLDWLAENISDLFYDELQDDYVSVQTSVVNILQDELNELLQDPIVPCS